MVAETPYDAAASVARVLEKVIRCKEEEDEKK